jgi:ligand-binding sensor domain-containing protein
MDNKINDLALDNEGKMWIATDSGANSYSANSWASYRDSLSYTNNGQSGESVARVVNSISTGSNGAIWFGLKGGGLVRFNRNSTTKVWTRFTQTTGISYNYVNSVAINIAYNEAWVGTNLGVSRYIPDPNIADKGIWLSVDISGHVGTNKVMVVKSNVNDNSIWFATFDKGLLMYDNDITWQAFPIPSQYDPHLTTIAFDANNTLWVGRPDGVSRLTTNTTVWKHYSYDENTNNVMPHQTAVYAIVSDLKNSRWFGTNKGLMLLQDTTWTIFNHSTTPDLPSDTIRALAYDSKGNLWIGTYNGIAVYNPNGTKLK